MTHVLLSKYNPLEIAKIHWVKVDVFYARVCILDPLTHCWYIKGPTESLGFV